MFGKKDSNFFKRKAIINKLLYVWDEAPDLTLYELISYSTGSDIEKNIHDVDLVDKCKNFVSNYKKENSLKNKIKKGLRLCVTKMTLW
jgi:hypothetical protein